jgi:hypothetical protein
VIEIGFMSVGPASPDFGVSFSAKGQESSKSVVVFLADSGTADHAKAAPDTGFFSMTLNYLVSIFRPASRDVFAVNLTAREPRFTPL